MSRRGILKERILQKVSVAKHVAMSRRVHRYKLSLRGRQQNARRQYATENIPSHFPCGMDRTCAMNMSLPKTFAYASVLVLWCEVMIFMWEVIC